MAKKLKECNVFGVSSDEYLNYAKLNRAEWEEKGQDMVKDMLQQEHAELEGLPEEEQFTFMQELTASALPVASPTAAGLLPNVSVMG